MRQTFSERFPSGSLTLAQGRLLVYVARHEGVRQVELAALLEVQPITLGRMVDQLQRHGLVRRQPDPQDRRAYRVVLTSAAKVTLQRIETVARTIRTDAMCGFSAAESSALLDQLKRVRANLAARPAPASLRGGRFVETNNADVKADKRSVAVEVGGSAA